MRTINVELQPADLAEALERLWQVATPKVIGWAETSASQAAPVFTVQGRYRPQGWTDWTQGFQIGALLLLFDATGNEQCLRLGRELTWSRMAAHLTHFGVHDHGFNNVSTFGNLRRLMLEQRLPHDPHELRYYELALKVSGAVQATRWSQTADGDGYIYSFNGPHSLFCDTIRSLRSLALSYRLGHVLGDENDERICLLDRLVQHARTTDRYSIYYGRDRDQYDVRGRVAHESIFNVNDGRYRCPSTQQGYSPFSTWTRGLAWIMLGYTEIWEFLQTLSDEQLDAHGGRADVERLMRAAAEATCDYYLDESAADGIPYWDTGAASLAELPGYRERPADPWNEHEPVDSSAAAIACQGLLRLGRLLGADHSQPGHRYWQAGLMILRTLLGPPYLAESPNHEGLLLHAVYHRPRGWDYVPPGSKIPCGEACQWGDYHLLEAALLVHRLIRGDRYYCFFGPADRQ